MFLTPFLKSPFTSRLRYLVSMILLILVLCFKTLPRYARNFLVVEIVEHLLLRCVLLVYSCFDEKRTLLSEACLLLASFPHHVHVWVHDRATRTFTLVRALGRQLSLSVDGPGARVLKHRLRTCLISSYKGFFCIRPCKCLIHHEERSWYGLRSSCQCRLCFLLSWRTTVNIPFAVKRTHSLCLMLDI